MKTVVAMKHKKVFEKMAENGGNLSKAVRDCGYSKVYASNSTIQKTKTFQELAAKYLPDDLILEKTQALLQKKEVLVRGPLNEIIETGEIDAYAVKSGVEFAAKLRKLINDDTPPPGGANRSLSDEEIEGRIAGILSGIIRSFAGKGKKKSS